MSVFLPAKNLLSSAALRDQLAGDPGDELELAADAQRVLAQRNVRAPQHAKVGADLQVAVRSADDPGRPELRSDVARDPEHTEVELGGTVDVAGGLPVARERFGISSGDPHRGAATHAQRPVVQLERADAKVEPGVVQRHRAAPLQAVADAELGGVGSSGLEERYGHHDIYPEPVDELGAPTER